MLVFLHDSSLLTSKVLQNPNVDDIYDYLFALSQAAAVYGIIKLRTREGHSFYNSGVGKIND